jgi:hypothetical protein
MPSKHPTAGVLELHLPRALDHWECLIAGVHAPPMPDPAAARRHQEVDGSAMCRHLFSCSASSAHTKYTMVPH